MFNYEESVKALEGSIPAVFPNHKELSDTIKRDLVSTFVSAEKKNVDTQTTSSETTRTTRTDPWVVPDCRSYRDIEPDG